MKKSCLHILSLLLLCAVLSAQSDNVFTAEEYLDIVRRTHPVTRQANLLQAKAEARLREARGGFDPKLYGDYEDKQFDSKDYFKIGEAGLKIPLWFGADLKAGYTWSSGVFLNPENSLPSQGQAIIGAEVSVLQGLLFDKRREQVRQAQLLEAANEAERRAVRNDLILDAAMAYWNWAFNFQTVKIYEESVELAENRFVGVRESFLQGDKPAVDTLEALIQIQTRRLDYQRAQVDYLNAGLELSNYLWSTDGAPLEITERLRPELPTADLIPEMPDISRDALRNSHPDLQQILIKRESLAIKERLKREALKPDLRVNFNLLGTGTNFLPSDVDEGDFTGLLTENYKWGATLEYPIFLRKARGGLDFVRLEQSENELKLDGKQLEIQNKIRAALNEARNTATILQLQEEATENYRLLLTAENEKFRIGESSIFLLNSREQKLIEARLKTAKAAAELEKTAYKLEWAAGRLF